jgi:hypothetical protein
VGAVLGSVLIWTFQALAAALSVLRIHSETFCLLAFARAAIAFRSSGAKRTGTILPFAAPLGSLGRPILAFFCAKVSRLLHDCGSYRVLRRFNGVQM